MKSLFFIVMVISTLAAQVGCRAIPSSTQISLSHVIKSSEGKDVAIIFTGLGYMSLGFERNKICDVRERDVCAAMIPTENMMLHREAYNRTTVKFTGSVERVSEGGYCTRECSYPVIRILSAQAAKEIHPDRSKAAIRAIDFERVAFDTDVTAHQALAGLVEELLSARGRDARIADFLQSSMTAGAVDTETRDRIMWISHIIDRDVPSRRDMRVRPYHMVQMRDDLEPAKLSDDGLLCFCLYNSCNRSEARLDVMNQSISDPILCLPVDRSSGQWKFEREFFRPELKGN